MPENQNIEYKESWHDNYLKWLCGFANANGGKLYVGTNDNGDVTGLSEYKELMNILPNKIRDLIGIMPDVNLLQENNLYYIEIVTKPSSVPLSLRGRYYYRSGSTNQELSGASLSDFLLRKSGRTWDDVIQDGASMNDINEKSVMQFIQNSKDKGRLPDVTGLDVKEILGKLRLLDESKIKRRLSFYLEKLPLIFILLPRSR